MSLTFANTANVKQEQDRAVLLQVLQDENAKMNELSESFYAQTVFTPEQDMSYCQRIVTAVDRVLSAGDWETSLFLRNTIKPMKAMREQALETIALLQSQMGKSEKVNALILEEEQRFVYLSLFQAKGDDLTVWARQLRSIQRHLSGRPIYENEEDVQSALRLTGMLASANQAYVVLVITDDMIEPVDPFADAERRDRHGKPLIALKSGVISSEDIVEFVHEKKRYRFVNGRLILQR